MKISKKRIIVILLSIVSLTFIALASLKLIPFFISLKDPKKQEIFKTYIINLRWKGWLTILVIQILQIFIAFIPGEIVELLSVMIYGSLGGLLICLLGILIGSILIYYTINIFYCYRSSNGSICSITL